VAATEPHGHRGGWWTTATSEPASAAAVARARRAGMSPRLTMSAASRRGRFIPLVRVRTPALFPPNIFGGTLMSGARPTYDNGYRPRTGRPLRAWRAHRLRRSERGLYLVTIRRVGTDRDGRIRTGEMSDRLDVAPPSVTEMFRRLAAAGFLQYEKRTGVILPTEGGDCAGAGSTSVCRPERSSSVIRDSTCRLKWVTTSDTFFRTRRSTDCASS